MEQPAGGEDDTGFAMAPNFQQYAGAVDKIVDEKQLQMASSSRSGVAAGGLGMGAGPGGLGMGGLGMGAGLSMGIQGMSS